MDTGRSFFFPVFFFHFSNGMCKFLYRIEQIPNYVLNSFTKKLILKKKKKKKERKKRKKERNGTKMKILNHRVDALR